jgi:transcriptional regulator with XRE-family HTH domain
MKTMGQSLRDERERAGLTVKDLVRLSGVPESTIRHYEASICSRQIENLCALADVLGLTLDEIVGHEPVKPKRRGVRKGTVKLELAEQDLGTLCICAIRYCHGRQTYMPSLVRDIVRPLLSKLSNKDLGVMVNDCGFQRRMELYGDDVIDKPGWLKWEQELIAEQARREEDKT